MNHPVEIIVAAGRVTIITVAPIVLYAWVISNPAYGKPDYDVPLMVAAAGMVAIAVLSVSLQLFSPSSPTSTGIRSARRWPTVDILLLAVVLGVLGFMASGAHRAITYDGRGFGAPPE